MYLILFIPALIVIGMALAYRFVIHRKPLGTRGWLISTSATFVLSLVLLTSWGIWLPDVFGKQHTLCSATTATGHRISIVQYWNHVDFYTTEARVIGPDGVTSVTVIDGDASKTWSARLEIDPSQNLATYWIPTGRTDTLTW